ALRTFAVQNIPLTIIVLLIASAGIVWGYVAFRKFFATEDKKIVLTSVLLFLVPLIPFIGFGNISPRYVYVSAVGVILFLMFLLMKLYSKAAIMHKSVVLVGIFIAVVGYGYFHITELKRINEDWRQAGEISSSTLTDLSLT